MDGNMNCRNLISFTLISVFICMGSCGKLNDSMSGISKNISPEATLQSFFETWKKRDWKTLYSLAHPGLIQEIRMGNLSPEERRMDDEQLFIRHFERASRNNPDKVLRSYQVLSISEYKAGDTSVWADTIVNGKKKRIPLTLVGLSLRVDLTKIE